MQSQQRVQFQDSKHFTCCGWTGRVHALRAPLELCQAKVPKLDLSSRIVEYVGLRIRHHSCIDNLGVGMSQTARKHEHWSAHVRVARLPCCCVTMGTSTLYATMLLSWVFPLAASRPAGRRLVNSGPAQKEQRQGRFGSTTSVTSNAWQAAVHSRRQGSSDSQA